MRPEACAGAPGARQSKVNPKDPGGHSAQASSSEEKELRQKAVEEFTKAIEGGAAGREELF